MAGTDPENTTSAAPARQAEPEKKPFMSEGVREELERTGRAIDPLTGERLGDWSDQK